jgi:glycosyltransferase involved in cell wall biosynthesis
MPGTRIAFVSAGTQAFGTNYRVVGLARNLHRLGVDVHILLPDLPANRQWFPEGHYGGVPIHFTAAGGVREMRSKYEALCALRPRFVHCVDVIKPCLPPSAAYRMRHKCELIVDLDEHLSRIKMFGYARRLFYLLGENASVQFADRLVVASRFLQKQFGAPRRDSAFYLPNAVDLDLFLEQRSGWEQIKKQWGNRKVVTYFGALQANYDADMVFEAAVQIVSRRRDIVFVFVGGGALLQSLRERTKQLRLEDSIHWCGFVPDEHVPKYLSAADALVFPIRDNWWNWARCPGKVYYFTAAMAPIVTNAVGEVREALGDRAWYFKNGDVQDFVRILEACLAAGRTEACPDMEMARQHSWQTRAESYLRFLECNN